MVEVKLWPSSLEAPPIRGIGLIDTGASHTCIDGTTARTYKFREAISFLDSKTFSADGVKENTKMYIGTLEIAGLEECTDSLTMPEFAGKGQPGDTPFNYFLLLIGRNTLSKFRLSYNNPAGEFTLESW